MSWKARQCPRHHSISVLVSNAKAVLQEQVELLRSAAEVLGNAQHLCPFEDLASYHSTLVERMRALTADVKRDFANVCDVVATADDLTREHVEKMSVAATSLNGVMLPVSVAAHLTKAVARLVQLCCDGSGDSEFRSAAVSICTNLEVNDQRVSRRDRDIAGQRNSVSRRILRRGHLQ